MPNSQRDGPSLCFKKSLLFIVNTSYDINLRFVSFTLAGTDKGIIGQLNTAHRKTPVPSKAGMVLCPDAAAGSLLVYILDAKIACTLTVTNGNTNFFLNFM